MQKIFFHSFLIAILFTVNSVIGQTHDHDILKTGKEVYEELQREKKHGDSKLYQFFTEAKTPELSFRHNEFVTGQKYFLVDKVKTREIFNDQPELLRLQVPMNGESVILDLYRKDIFSPNYLLRTSDGEILSKTNTGAFYRGIIEGNDRSIAVVSFLRDEMRIMFSDDSDDYRINKTNHGNYVYFKESKLLKKKPFECHVEEVKDEQEKNLSTINSRVVLSGGCVEIYFECDFESYQDNGSSIPNTEAWVAALFNEVSTLYQNENIPIAISEIFVWTSTDPYEQYSSTSPILTEFKSQIQSNGYTGRLAHLLSTRNIGGGRAYLNVLCSNTHQCGVSGNLGTNVVPFPNYSWNVEVITHELGHNFGSRHTHACAWNGNNTQIDDCGNEYAANNGDIPEGNSCYDENNPILPSNGGTIMSYCHLISGVGISFNEGFGPEVGPFIYNKFTNASCATGNCSAPDCTFLSSPVNGQSEVFINSDLEWAQSADATGYRLTVGTTSGGTDILDNFDVGNVTFYDLPQNFPCDTQIFVTIIPYNGSGDASGCQEESFSTEGYTVDAGPDGFMCEGGSVQLVASSGFFYSWSPTSGLSDPNIANPIAFPSATTIYTVTAQNANGCEDTDEVVVTVYTLPPADAGPDAEICTGETLQLQASGGVLYTWSPVTGLSDPSIANPVASPEVTTTYTVSVIDENGCENSDDITITVYTNPSPIITGEFEICDGNATTLVATSGFENYAWNTGASTQQIVAFTPGTYIVTVIDENGCEGSDTVSLTVHPLPTANAGEDEEMCPDELVQLQASGGTSYTWSPTSGLNNPNIADPIASPMTTTTYVVTAFDANGCTDTDSVQVTVHANPLADAGIDQSIPNGTSTMLIGSATLGSGNYGYMWSPANLLTNPNVQNPTTINLFSSQVFTLDVVDIETGCTGIDEVTILVSGDPLEVVLSAGSMSICEGTSTQLFATPTGGSGNYTYSWTSVPSGFTSTLANPVVSPNVTTTYFVTIDDGFSTEEGSVEVVVKPMPIVDLGEDQQICYGESIQLCTEEYPGANYLWTTGETTQCITVSPISSTDFAVTLSLPNGCSANDTVDVVVNPQLVLSIENTNESELGAADGSAWAIVNGGTPPYNYNWSNGSADSLISNLTPGTYELTVMDQMGCQASGTVVINPGDCGELTINSTVIHPLCYGDCNGSISIESINGGTDPYSFEWSEGNTGSTLTDLCDDTYTVTITDVNQCQQIQSYTLIEPELLIVELSADSTFSFSGGTMPLMDTTYSVTGNLLFIDITDSNGCVATDSLMLVAVDEVTDIPIRVYPNPVREILYLDYPTDIELDEVEFIDIYGRIVSVDYNLEKKEINVQSLVEGYYFVCIRNEALYFVFSFVVVR